MHRTHTMLLLPLALLTIGLAAVSGPPVLGSTPVNCLTDETERLDGSADLANGLGTAAVMGGSLVSIDPNGERVLHPYAEGTMALRHVATAAGSGAVFVEDRKGPDAIVRVQPSGVDRIEVAGEATHPTLGTGGRLAYAVDLARIDVHGSDGPTRSYPRPAGTLSVFSPLFTEPGAIVAVVEEPSSGPSDHEDGRNNLFRLDLATGEWGRLTDLPATGGSFSVIRTPVIDGAAILFVRIQGDPAAASEPSFELWRLNGVATKVRDVPGEAFLVAVATDGTLWNVFLNGEWHILKESDRGLEDLGCGAVMVDPRTQPDPDKAPEGAALAATPPAVGGEGASLAIAVGDFASRTAAEVVARTLDIREARVVDHVEEPAAVGPEAFAVAVPLPAQADPVAALEAFRARFPAQAERSWIVTLTAS